MKNFKFFFSVLSLLIFGLQAKGQLTSVVSDFTGSSYQIINISQVIPDLQGGGSSTTRGDGYAVVGTVKNTLTNQYCAYLSLYNFWGVEIWSRVYNLAAGSSIVNCWATSVAQGPPASGFAILGTCTTNAGLTNSFLIKTDFDGYVTGPGVTGTFADTINSGRSGCVGLFKPVKVLMNASSIFVLGTNKWAINYPNNWAAAVVEYDFNGAYVNELEFHSTNTNHAASPTNMSFDNSGNIYVVGDINDRLSGNNSSFFISKLTWNNGLSHCDNFIWGKEYTLALSGSPISHIRTSGITVNGSTFAISFHIASDQSFLNSVKPCLAIGNPSTGAINYIRRYYNLSNNTYLKGIVECSVNSNTQYNLAGYSFTGSKDYSIGIFTDGTGIPNGSYPIINYGTSPSNPSLTTTSDSFTSVTVFGAGASNLVFGGVATAIVSSSSNLYQLKVTVNTSGWNGISCNSTGTLDYDDLTYSSSNISTECDYSNMRVGGVTKDQQSPTQTYVSACGHLKQGNETGFKPLNQDNIELYPVPAFEYFKISNLKLPNLYEASIYDVTGRKFKLKYTVDGSDLYFDVKSIPAGLYFISLSGTNGNISSKLFLILK